MLYKNLQLQTYLQVWNRIECLDNFVGLKRTVSAVADRHEATVPTL